MEIVWFFVGAGLIVVGMVIEHKFDLITPKRLKRAEEALDRIDKIWDKIKNKF